MEPANGIKSQSCKSPIEFKEDFMELLIIPLLLSPSSCSSLLELGPCSFCSASPSLSARAVLKPLPCSVVVPCSVLSGKSITLRRSPLSLKPLASHSILRGT
ncbi:hypothetical protein HN873_001833 [Arachis hypogaea]|nr:uncharacterized protein LOC112805973 [Arachis hypogaea]